jgi:hypothetical protein
MWLNACHSLKKSMLLSVCIHVRMVYVGTGGAGAPAQRADGCYSLIMIMNGNEYLYTCSSAVDIVAVLAALCSVTAAAWTPLVVYVFVHLCTAR